MFWENFVKLCENARKSPTGVVSELQISRGSVTHWKMGKVPHHSTLITIADYFGVSQATLLELDVDQKEKPVTNGDELTESQRYLIEMVPKLSDDQAKMLRAVIEQVLAETAL